MISSQRKRRSQMKRTLIAMTLAALAAGIASGSAAQEQKAGQPLAFPDVEQVQQRPSDLHVGSDPYYRPGRDDLGGTDQAGYPQQYDPGRAIQQEETVYKPAEEEKEAAPPPSRWRK
jgi:hypothetical protein